MRASVAAGVALLGFGAWIFGRVYLYTAETGDSFPEYSSLRAGPKGTKALHDALAELPGMRVDRWYKPTRELKQNGLVLFRLDDPTQQWNHARPEDLLDWEERVRRGLRLVVALRPYEAPLRIGAPKPDAKAPETPAIETAWKLAVEPELKVLGGDWRVVREEPVVVERTVGKGSIVFISRSFPFSNEALRDRRDTALLAEAVGPYRSVMFDEHRLGVAQTGSVGSLLRKFGLEAAAGALVLVAVLFVWRSASAFPPPVESTGPPPVAGRDSAAALASLLRHNIAPGALPAAALDIWRKSAALYPALHQNARRQIETELEGAKGKPLPELWRRLHEIRNQRS